MKGDPLKSEARQRDGSTFPRQELKSRDHSENNRLHHPRRRAELMRLGPARQK